MSSQAHRRRLGRIDGLDGEAKRIVLVGLSGGRAQNAILADLNAVLSGRGEPPISKAALSRFACKMERDAQAAREVRAMADAWTVRMGETPGADLIEDLTDVLSTATMETVVRLKAEPGEADPQTIDKLARTVQRLTRARALSRRREKAVRRDAREQAAAAAGEVARRARLSPAVADAIRAAIVGEHPADAARRAP